MKTYQFKMYFMGVDFYNGGLSIIYSAGTKRDFEIIEATWADAQKRFEEFAAKIPAPAVCFLMCTSPRKPNGFKSAQTMIYRRP